MFRIVWARIRARIASVHPRGLRRAGRVLNAAALTVVVSIAVVAGMPSAAHADTGLRPGSVAVVAVNNLPTVVANLQAWVMGILAAVATLFLVLAGLYWVTAGGDPAQVDRARQALRNALVGYGLALLAPVLLQVVKNIVGA